MTDLATILNSALPDWMFSAVCPSTDPNLFYSEGKGHDPRPAKRICGGCPSRVECATWALERDEGYGVWGGLTAPERRRMLRRGWRAGDRLPEPLRPRRRSVCPHCRCEFVDLNGHILRSHAATLRSAA